MREQRPENGTAAGITEAEFAARKAYLDLGDADVARLRALHELLAGGRADVINQFYAHLLSHEATSALLGDEENLLRLKKTQAAYFDGLTAGDYGLAYARERVRVGVAHQRIGLAPVWYIGAYSKYLELLLAELWRVRQTQDHFALEATQALLKVTFLDIGMAIDTYMAERERRIMQKMSQLAALNEVAAAINSSLEVGQVLGEVMRAAVRITESYASTIAFFDPARGGFHDWVTHGLSERFVAGMAFPPGTVADEAFSASAHVLSNDLPGTRHRLSALARAEGIRSFLCLPLGVKDRPLGVLYVYRRDRDGFEPEEISLLRTFAHLAAGAIANARLHEDMTALASRDGLTGAHNRRSFDERFAFELQRARRLGRALSLLVLDVDHFKRVNDTHGHEAGDLVLQALAALLERSVRQGVDMTARLGGEEFAVLLTETDAAGALCVAERVRGELSDLAVALPRRGTICVTASIGVCVFPEAGASPAALLRQADRALYEAKSRGRNRTVLWSTATAPPAPPEACGLGGEIELFSG